MELPGQLFDLLQILIQVFRHHALRDLIHRVGHRSSQIAQLRSFGSQLSRIRRNSPWLHWRIGLLVVDLISGFSHPRRNRAVLPKTTRHVRRSKWSLSKAQAHKARTDCNKHTNKKQRTGSHGAPPGPATISGADTTPFSPLRRKRQQKRKGPRRDHSRRGPGLRFCFEPAIRTSISRQTQPAAEPHTSSRRTKNPE